jgi:hypothetical protein
MPVDAAAEEQEQLYGPWTQGAVRTFQAKHGLAQDSIVGPRTWAALQGGVDAGFLPDEVRPDFSEAGRLMARALEIALQQLRDGVAEVPLGSNRGPRVDEYLLGRRMDGAYLLHARKVDGYPEGYQGAPWCARFALWCIERAAFEMAATLPVDGWGDLASSWKWKDQALQRGKLMNKPRAGRAGLILVPPGPNGEKAHGHVVLVARAAGDRLVTLEGNSANRVASRQRQTSEFVGFVDLAA